MKKSVLAVIIVVAMLVGGLTSTFFWNRYGYAVQKIDDATNYETLKEVENTCRALISSYTADKLRYEIYSESDDPERLEWAEQARIRANSTAVKYNEYYLKNSFVWKDNVPDDIAAELPYL